MSWLTSFTDGARRRYERGTGHDRANDGCGDCDSVGGLGRRGLRQAKGEDKLGFKAQDEPTAYVCHGRRCLAPAQTDAGLTERLQEASRTS